MEIERKFTIRQLPELAGLEKKELEQGYLNRHPVVRVRKTVKGGSASYLLCYKSKHVTGQEENATANVSEEVEVWLDWEGYEHLLSKADGRIITKTRYLIPYGAYTIELDVFEGVYSGLVFAEVEFPNEEEANAFVPPEWFETDVTFDERFRNSYLSASERSAEEMFGTLLLRKTGNSDGR